MKLQMEQRIDEFIELFEGYEEQNLGSITKGIVKDAIMSWVRQNGVDTLTHHKWPEEKPERLGRYLCCMEDTAGYKQFDTARWGYVNGNGMSGQTWVGDHWSDGDIYEYEILDVKYWWELPEV